MNTQLLQQARVLGIDEQIELVEAIWDGIVSRGAAPALTEAQKTELDRRLADHLANPNDVVPWSEVKAAVLANTRHGQGLNPARKRDGAKARRPLVPR